MAVVWDWLCQWALLWWRGGNHLSMFDLWKSVFSTSRQRRYVSSTKKCGIALCWWSAALWCERHKFLIADEGVPKNSSSMNTFQSFALCGGIRCEHCTLSCKGILAHLSFANVYRGTWVLICCDGVGGGRYAASNASDWSVAEFQSLRWSLYRESCQIMKGRWIVLYCSCDRGADEKRFCKIQIQNSLSRKNVSHVQ